MCQTLYQIYACGHDKLICTTPCLNVLKSQSTTGVDHQDPVHRSDSQRQSIISTAIASEQETHVPAFRFVTSASQVPSTISTPTTVSPTPRSPASPSPSQHPQPRQCEKARDLRRSFRPCLACYVKPEYAALRQTWMDMYRREHPLGRSEDVAKWSGIERLVHMSEEEELRAWKRGRVAE